MVCKFSTGGKSVNLIPIKSHYCIDNSLAITLVEAKSYAPFVVLTVNLFESLKELDIVLPKDIQAVDTNHFPGAEQFIKDNDLGTPIGVSISSGFCDYPLYKFNLSKLREEV